MEMKVFIIILLFFINGCYRYPMHYNPHGNIISKRFDVKDIDSSFSKIKINKTSNYAILDQYKLPSCKILYDDGSYEYIYINDSYSQPDEIKSKLIKSGYNIGSNVVKTGSKLSLYVFKFNKKNVVTSAIHENNIFNTIDRYENINIENQKNKVDQFVYFQKLALGTKKGTIFRELGKPIYSELKNNEENWLLLLDNSSKTNLTVLEQKLRGLNSPFKNNEINKYMFINYEIGTKIAVLNFIDSKLVSKNRFTIMDLKSEKDYIENKNRNHRNL